MEFERIDGLTLLPRLPHRETRVGEMRPPPAEPSLTSGGHKKSVIAVAPAMLVTAYPLLARQTTYQDPGADYYDRRHAERVRRRAIQTLERRGYLGILEPAA